MLDQRYALVAQLIMNCMFYAAIFPIGVLITILGMIVTYWSSKWWLLNYCSLPRFSHRLGRHIVHITLCRIFLAAYFPLYMLLDMRQMRTWLKMRISNLIEFIPYISQQEQYLFLYYSFYLERGQRGNGLSIIGNQFLNEWTNENSL